MPFPAYLASRSIFSPHESAGRRVYLSFLSQSAFFFAKLYGAAAFLLDTFFRGAGFCKYLCLLLLDAGLLFTLYLGWRRALEWSAWPGRAVWLLLPWATVVAAEYAAAIWILLQPMHMRGVIMNP